MERRQRFKPSYIGKLSALCARQTCLLSSRHRSWICRVTASTNGFRMPERNVIGASQKAEAEGEQR